MYFRIKRGIRQVAILSHYCLTYTLNKLSKRKIKINGTFINNVRYDVIHSIISDIYDLRRMIIS